MIPLPNLPTDNLYKFKVFGGFALLFFAAYIFIFQAAKHLEDLSTERQLTAEYQIQINQFSKTLNDLTINAKNFKNKIDVKIFNDSLKKESYRDYAEFMIKNDIVNLNSDDALIFQIYENRIKKINLKIDLIDSKIQAQSVKTNFDFPYLIVLSLIVIISTFVGENIIRKGFKEWMEKVQIPLDKKLQQEIQKDVEEDIKDNFSENINIPL